MNIPWLEQNSPLPKPEFAQKIGAPLAGLLAAGGGLGVPRLCEAYRNGVFPWFSEGQPILWWSPDPRMVLQCSEFKLHRSLRRTLTHFIASPDCEIRIDYNFGAVIEQCAQTKRKGQPGTWIVHEMIEAYQALHQAGFEHSVETWQQGQLVGGLYCVSMGDTLFGESMFAHQTDSSKIALAALVAFARKEGFAWIDCQQNTRHLASLGAREMPRSDFLALVRGACMETHHVWQFEKSTWNSLMPSKV